MKPQSMLMLILLAVALLAARHFGVPSAPAQDARQGAAGQTPAAEAPVDDTQTLQRLADRGGDIRLASRTYRITKPIVIDLERSGFTSLHGGGVARIEMAGPGPALKFVGTHQGTASPATVQDNVWQRQRTPMADGVEIVGAHEQAVGIEASGTMQLTLTRVAVRDALHGIHLVERNRNVAISDCHLYDNRGVGVYLDRLNLHQVNIVNCHISYNAAGGVVARQSEIRNLQIGSCDIEGNMGGPDSPPAANVWLDSAGSSIGEVAIVGCTIQHSHDAPDSANIRINGRSTPRQVTSELRHGNITIANNVLSDVQVNVEVRQARAVAITGNTMWKGYARNLLVEGCQNVVVSGNVFDRNPRYHYGDGDQARLGLLLSGSTDCTISGNQLYGVGDVEAALVVRDCARMNITGCTITAYGQCGLLLDNSRHCRVSDCLIRQDGSAVDGSAALRVLGGRGNMVVDNLLQDAPQAAPESAVSAGNEVGE